jgi:transcriptional regulator with XRE-family HTH domain
MDETRRIEVRRFWEVERLTMRQIAEKMGMGRRTVTRILKGEPAKKPRKPSIIVPYERLIAEWYKTTPALMAIQVLNRIRGYGYTGGYGAVKLRTMEFRKMRAVAFFELTFLPGEAQVDWMEWKVGDEAVYGFVYVLAWSRYAVIHFYPRHTLEFFVEFDLNRYSVPTTYAEAAAEILAFPDTVEVLIGGRRVAVHPRLFGRKEKTELPAHREGLLLRSPRTKFQRIYELMAGLGPEPEIKRFLENAQAEGKDAVQAAYVMFRLLRGIAKETLLSAVREANSLKVYKIKYVHSLLESSGAKEPPTVRPQDERLLDINYETRSLDDYDDLI